MYGVATYALAMGVIVYGIGFAGAFAVPRTVDAGGPSAPLGVAIAIDVGLTALFAVQHTVMARAAFKRAWTRVIAEPYERTTYVLATTLALAAIFGLWHPIDVVVWDIAWAPARAAAWAIFALGWALVVVSTFLIDHFDLFGVRQVMLNARGVAYTAPAFRMRALYKLVRHPLMLGLLLAFWATPRMTVGHLVFTLAMSVYIVVGVRFEERGLRAELGDDYRRYCESVPMLLPIPRPRRVTRQGP